MRSIWRSTWGSNVFSEVLKIIPRLDTATATAMEKSLNTRFQRIAKKFGGGIMNVIKSGGVLGVATALIDKVLNPLQSIQESIEKTLQQSGDLQTYAEHFGTSAGSLARLQAFGRAKGLEPEGVRLLLGKFQSSIAQAAGDPSKPSAVSAFVGKADTAEAFFEFIQSLQKLSKVDPNAALRVQSEVFGEKQILKAADFLSADFKKLAFQIGGPTAQQLSRDIKDLDTASDFLDTERAKRELADFSSKAALVPQTIGGLLEGEDRALRQDNYRLTRFEHLKKISMATDEMLQLLEKAYLELSPYLAKVLPEIMKEIGWATKGIETSRTIRGMVPGAGKDR